MEDGKIYRRLVYLVNGIDESTDWNAECQVVSINEGNEAIFCIGPISVPFLVSNEAAWSGMIDIVVILLSEISEIHRVNTSIEFNFKNFNSQSILRSISTLLSYAFSSNFSDEPKEGEFSVLTGLRAVSVLHRIKSFGGNVRSNLSLLASISRLPDARSMSYDGENLELDMNLGLPGEDDDPGWEELFTKLGVNISYEFGNAEELLYNPDNLNIE